MNNDVKYGHLRRRQIRSANDNGIRLQNSRRERFETERDNHIHNDTENRNRHELEDPSSPSQPQLSMSSQEQKQNISVSDQNSSIPISNFNHSRSYTRKPLTLNREDTNNNNNNEEAGASGTSGAFDCNICLCMSTEPVTTLCGHLFCWPCIYQWCRQSYPSYPNNSMNNMNNSNNTNNNCPYCPVCKSPIKSNYSIIPLYGSGLKRNKNNILRTAEGEEIPSRPSASLLSSLLSSPSNQQRNQNLLYTSSWGSFFDYDGNSNNSNSNNTNNNSNNNSNNGFSFHTGFGVFPALFGSLSSHHPSYPILRDNDVNSHESLSRLFLALGFLLIVFLLLT